jgi:hypothetical protein
MESQERWKPAFALLRWQGDVVISDEVVGVASTGTGKERATKFAVSDVTVHHRRFTELRRQTSSKDVNLSF